MQDKVIEKSWSLLASAILKQYYKDKEKNPDAYIDPDWYEVLWELATRFSGRLDEDKENCKNRRHDIIKYYYEHSTQETLNKFKITRDYLYSICSPKWSKKRKSL